MFAPQISKQVTRTLTGILSMLGVLCALVGCGAVPGFFGSDVNTPLSLASLASADAFFESNANDAFDSAEFVPISAESTVIRGSISGAGDVDIYDLGSIESGVRVLIRMTTDTSLDGAIALFDESGTSLLVNDHRNVFLGQRQPFIDVVLRRSVSSCFVAVSATPGFDSVGDYGLVATATPSNVVPAPRPDTILLAFDGGNGVRVGSRQSINVPPFDTADIDPVYRGRTDTIISTVVASVRADYEEYDVTILSTSEGAPFDGVASRVYFGTFDAALLGVAEGVDEYNASQSQEAIVFTNTFEVFMQLEPSSEEMAQALANVASHEVGHLLGLIHTADVQGVMDVTASLNQLLHDQSFRRSPIYSEVFPIGYQDAIQSLMDTVGGKGRPGLRGLEFSEVVNAALEPTNAPPGRLQARLSTCSLGKIH